VVKSFPTWVRFPRRSGSGLHYDLQGGISGKCEDIGGNTSQGKVDPPY